MSEETIDATLRDEFAKAIIPALIATAADPRLDSMVDGASSLLSAARSFGWESPSDMHGEDGEPLTLAEVLAGEAFDLANAMVRERERPEPPVVPVGGECISSGTPGRAPARPVPAPSRTTQLGGHPEPSADTPTEPPAGPSKDHQSSGEPSEPAGERGHNPKTCRHLQQHQTPDGSPETPGFPLNSRQSEQER